MTDKLKKVTVELQTVSYKNGMLVCYANINAVRNILVLR